jgi:hypothetical protein
MKEELEKILKECMRNFGLENGYRTDELENLEGYAYEYIEHKGIDVLCDRLKNAEDC